MALLTLPEGPRVQPPEASPPHTPMAQGGRDAKPIILGPKRSPTVHLEKEVVLEHSLHWHHQQVPQGEPPIVCSLRTFLGGQRTR